MSDAHINLSKTALAIMEQLAKPRTYLYRNRVATVDVDKEATFCIIHLTDETVDESYRGGKHPFIMVTGPQFSSKIMTPIAAHDALEILKHPEFRHEGHVYDPNYDPTDDLRPLDYFWFRKSHQ
ncbi:hypothetical protein IAD21_03842 [Abditibacteriota bacterium]|nr:hypothetical protein IAD21_03842 [Abditibacteriota bacterium]